MDESIRPGDLVKFSPDEVRGDVPLMTPHPVDVFNNAQKNFPGRPKPWSTVDGYDGRVTGWIRTNLDVALVVAINRGYALLMVSPDSLGWQGVKQLVRQ